jgi:hypothetical protein
LYFPPAAVDNAAMPKKVGGDNDPTRYWKARVRSRAFRRALTELATREIRALAGARFRNVVNRELVRTLIREFDVRLIDRSIVADLAVAVNRRMGARLAGRRESLLELIDRRWLADIEATLRADTEPSPRAEEFIAALMHREFVSSLLADVIYAAFVAFQERVNPLFGAFATRALEDQIKGFIRLVMPMLLTRAAAFALDPRNQRLGREFGVAVARQFLDVPLGRYAAMATSDAGAAAEALIRKTVENAKLGALTRQAALAVWEEVYAAIGSRRIGDLLRLEEHADWLAARCVDVIRPVLSHPHVLRFIASEMAMAARHPTPSGSRS